MVATIRKCKVCGTEFKTKPFHIKKGHGKYCSRACHYKDAQQRVLKFCDTCGGETFKKPTQVRRSKSGKFFCNKSCQTIWRNAHFHGTEHPNYKNGRHAYRSVLARNKVAAVCRRCVITDRRVLAVHHIDQNRTNSRVENLAWLCHNCHHIIHRVPTERKRLKL